MSKEYWRLFCDEVIPDILGVSISNEKVDELTKAAVNHREMEWEACGYQEADRSLKRMDKRDAQAEVFAFIEGLMADMDCGPGDWFLKLSGEQKMALATLGSARKHFEMTQRKLT